jgi:hypothetical protein
MSGFTDEIRSFLRSQGIAESEVCDASMLSPRRYKPAMEREGKLFAIVKNPCYRGHQLRSHKGHCIQCDTSRIAYVTRHHKVAYVYIVGSRRHRVIKIGWSETPWNRGPHLNNIGYGGIHDWELLYYASHLEAGKVELSADSVLSRYAAPRIWIREGEVQESREIFECSYGKAREALEAVSEAAGEGGWEHPSARLLYSDDSADAA